MVTLFKNFKIGMVAFGAMAFMLVAGWQFGVSGTDEVFTDKEVALENAIAGSGSECYNTITSSPAHQVRYCPTCSFVNNSEAVWYSWQKSC